MPPDISQESGVASIPLPDVRPGDPGGPGTSSGWGCGVCGRDFTTKTGLGVHVRRAHPAIANAQSAPPQVKRRWLNEELELLASTEARLIRGGSANINIDLLKALPNLGRTLEAIKGVRRKETYKQSVNAKLLSGSPSTPIKDTEQVVEVVVPGTSEEEVAEVQPVSGPEDMPLVADLRRDDRSTCVSVIEDLLARATERLMRGTVKSKRPRNNTRTRKTEVKLTSKRRRRMEYARVQELFRKFPGRAAAEVLDGECRGVRHQLHELEAYWRPVLETVSDASGPTPEALRAARRNGQYGGTLDRLQMLKLWSPFTEEEVKEAKPDLRSAPGPDGIRPEDWRSVPARIQAEIFNSWMSQGEIPRQLRQCRTVFVPKRDEPAGPGDYRPISIASVPLRHMHALLARRLEACCPPDARQRGFIRADGTLENSAVLDAVLGDCRKKLRECHIAVLDFAKAFDTVSHAALVSVLREKGLPVGFCDYIARLYDTAQTTLAVGNDRSEPVVVGRGVRQGDPLSPLLFNMALDVVLASLPKEVGYRLEGELVSALAYADDLVLLAGSKAGMQAAIDAVAGAGESLGLQLSRDKSSVLSMVPDGKRKKPHYVTTRSFKLGRRWLRQVDSVEHWRYLGVDMSVSGAATIELDVKQALDNIKKAPLKPQQRLEVVRTYLIPRFLHGLVLGNISDDRLRMLDVQIRHSVRQWLRLSKDVPIGYFHASTRDGGLGIPSLRTCVPDLIIRRFGKLDSSRWAVARAASKSERIRRKVKWAERQLRRFSAEAPRTGERTVTQYWREKLHNSVDGFELRESTKVPASTKWITKKMGDLNGRDYIQSVHTHINALPSRVRNSRGRRLGRESELNCRAGCMVRETTAHTIQQCFRTHGGRILRHNCVASFLAEELERAGWSVEQEPRIETAVGLRKPDIIASRGGEAGVIVDVQVVSGQRPLDDAHRDKRSKYGGHGELVEKVADRLGLTKDRVDVTSCTVSWRGVWSLGSYREMKKLLGLKETVFERIAVLTLKGSHMNWSRFNRTTTMVPLGAPD